MTSRTNPALGSLAFSYCDAISEWCAPLVKVVVDGTEWTVDATIADRRVRVSAFDYDGNTMSGTYAPSITVRAAVENMLDIIRIQALRAARTAA